MASLNAVPASPYRNGALSTQATQGRATFANRTCGSCHSGSTFTDSAQGVRHNVGTIHAGSGYRLGATLDGFDTPTLLGSWGGAPYLHDGSAHRSRPRSLRTRARRPPSWPRSPRSCAS